MKAYHESLAYETASKLTNEWMIDQLKSGLMVSEMQIRAKFKKHYNDFFLNKRMSEIDTKFSSEQLFETL